MELGWAKSAGQCGKQAFYACFDQFGRLEIELPLTILLKAKSFFCLFTLVGDQTVYKRWFFDVNRFY